MTTPLEPSIIISAGIVDLSTTPIGLPSDGNFGAYPSKPGNPNGDAPTQIIPGIDKNTNASDIIDAILTYLQTNNSLNVTKPTESLTTSNVATTPDTLFISNIKKAYRSGTATEVNVIPNPGSIPYVLNSNIVTPINISIGGGDIINCYIGIGNGILTNRGTITIDNYLDMPGGLAAIPDDGIIPAISVNGNLTINRIKDPYRVNSNGTQNATLIAEVFINNSGNIVNTSGTRYRYQIEIIPFNFNPTLPLLYPKRYTNILEFYLDDSITATPPDPTCIIANVSSSINTFPIPPAIGDNGERYTSGILSLSPNSNVTVYYTVSDVIGNFYNSDYVGRIYHSTGNNFQQVENQFTIDVADRIPVPTASENFISNILMQNENNNLVEPTVTVTAEAVASNGETNIFTYPNRLIIYDTASYNIYNNKLIREFGTTLSSNKLRVTDLGGTGNLFPVGYNAIGNITLYDSSINLSPTIPAINYELQLLNGLYQYPRNLSNGVYDDGSMTINNYIPKQSVTTYDNLPMDSTGYRWCSFVINGTLGLLPFIKNKNHITITLDNAVNLSGLSTAPYGIELLDNIKIYIKFIDIATPIPMSCGYSQNGIFTSTPAGSIWFDCNREGNQLTPTVDGDPVVDGSVINTLSTKKISFGTRSYTGRLLVRIGLKNPTLPTAIPDIKFSGVTIS